MAIASYIYRRHAFLWRDPPHPFVQRSVPSSDATIVVHSSAAGALHALVADHVVQGRVIFPGAGYLEMVRAAGAAALHGVYFLQPLAAESAGLLVECAMSDGHFEVRTRTGSGTLEDATVHCSGATAAAAAKGWQGVAHALLRTRSVAAADVGALYDGFDAVGLQYGPGYRTLISAWGSTSNALSRLRARATHEGTQVHPADLDDALCTSGVIGSGSGGETRLPFAVEGALLEGASGGLWAVRFARLLSRHRLPYSICPRICCLLTHGRRWRVTGRRRCRCGSGRCSDRRKRSSTTSSRVRCVRRRRRSAICTRQSGSSRAMRTHVARRSLP